MQNLNRKEIKYKEIFKSNVDTYQFFHFKDALLKSACKKTNTYLLWEQWRGEQPQGIDPSLMQQCQDLGKFDLCLTMPNGSCMPIEAIYLSIELKQFN